MITVDLHLHTSHSHGRHTTRAMVEAGLAKKLALLGFTEHAPRPDGYVYPKDYQDKLERNFMTYCDEVRSLRREYADRIELLLGAELDFIPGADEQMRGLVQHAQPDYVLGGVHFIGHWGFDFSPADWKALSMDACAAKYREYYALIPQMARFGVFDGAAHLDLVKLFSIENYRRWEASEEGQSAVGAALDSLAEVGMGLEISSAGLRKPCKEIYPGPRIMRMARERNLEVTFGSDAHSCEQVGWAFEQLCAYAAEHGFEHSVCYTPEGRRCLRY